MKWLWRALTAVVLLLVILFLVFRSPDTDPRAMRAKYAGAPSQFVALPDGQTIHLRDEGPRDAPAIILLHGSNSDLHTWQPWVERLKNRYRIIRYDQIGHGLTGPSIDGSYAVEAFARDVEEVANLLRLQRFVLAGNSMGGRVAAAYALENSTRLDGLVLIDASGAPVRQQGAGNIGFTIAALPGMNRVMEHVTPRSLIERSLRQSVSNQAIVTPAAVDRYWELLRYPGNRAATVTRFNSPSEPMTAREVATIGTPTLVMWGREDALIPVAAGEWYHRHLPSSRFVAFDGIGHLPMEEAPDASAAALADWLDAPVTPDIASVD